jgi:hypothetical protein
VGRGFIFNSPLQQGRRARCPTPFLHGFSTPPSAAGVHVVDAPCFEHSAARPLTRKGDRVAAAKIAEVDAGTIAAAPDHFHGDAAATVPLADQHDTAPAVDALHDTAHEIAIVVARVALIAATIVVARVALLTATIVIA